MEQFEMMGGRLHVYKRENSRYWQCSTYLAGKNRRATTKEENLSVAKSFAEDWYLQLKAKHKWGEIHDGKSFKEASDQFLREYEIITEGQRSPEAIDGHRRRLNIHLLPFLGDKRLTEITPGVIQEFRIHRREKAMAERGKQPARSSTHKDIVTLRQVLKTAARHGRIKFLPDLSEPYKTSGKITHRAWFSPEEYKKLYEATRRRVQNPPKKRWQWSREQLHDYVLFMANTGLRPDEAARLEFRNVTVVDDEAIDETILEIEVRGKRGVGYCKSMPGAVRPFQRLAERLRPILAEEGEGKLRNLKQKQAMRKPEPTDRLFPHTHRELFNKILDEEGLKIDREGQRRTVYSLFHTYICLRLMEGADI